MTKQIEIRGVIRVRVYDLLFDAVSEGIEYGWRRAHKHTDEPSDIDIKEHIAQAVIGSIGERFYFDDEGAA